MNFAGIRRFQMLLLPFSWLYAFGVWLRNFPYDRGWIRPRRLSVPVVSVGNLSAGGTGKTPVVIFLAKLYQSAGKRVGILTRGYGRETREPQILSGNAEDATPEQIGDEPFLILTELKKIGLAVDKKRERGAAKLLAKMPVDVFILDDGFQYRRLFKECEIVVLDATRPFDNGRLIPAGLLREPPRALARASLLWLTRVNRAADPEKTRTWLRRFSPKPVVQSFHAPVGLWSIDRKRQMPLEKLSGLEAIAFCAIGNPESFRQDLQDLGVRLRAFQAFPDHHVFTTADIENLKILATKRKVKYILCTEKDAVKISNGDDRFYFLKISIQIVGDYQILLDLLPGLR